MARLTRQLGYRVDDWVLRRFKELCKEEGLRSRVAKSEIIDGYTKRGHKRNECKRSVQKLNKIRLCVFVRYNIQHSFAVDDVVF